MKTKLQNLFLLLSVTGLAGCGAAGKNASLEVSRAFATTNTTFGGGLIISGKNLTTGKFFSQGLTTSMDFRTTLEKGRWKISAVGWDGGGSAGNEKPFAGNPYCGSVEADLTSDSSSVTLNINQANCNTAEFTSGRVDGSGNLREFGAIVTCNTFINPTVGPASTGAINTHFVAPGTGTDYFCTGIAPDLQTKVKATKIYALNKLPGQAADSMGFNSGCMQGMTAPNESVIFPTNASNPYNGYTLKLPYNNVPFTIVTYEDTLCTKPLAIYPFRNGLLAGNPEAFDSLILDRGSMDSKLLLPGNDMRRAKSSLVNLMPYFKKYNSGSPSLFATTPSNYATLTYPAFNGDTQKFVLKEEADCGGAPLSTSGPITASCTDLGDSVEITHINSGVGAASITINDAGPTPRRMINLTITENVYSPKTHAAQRGVIKLLGSDSTVDNDTFFLNDDKHDDKSYGALSMAREMFSASGAGGLLGVPDHTQTFAQNCNALSGEKSVTIYNHNEMVFETYRVNIHNTKVSAPTNYFCRTNTLSAADCNTGTGAFGYDKRMLIYDYKQSAITPVIVMEFSCAGYVGRLESNFIDVKGGMKNNNKKIVAWNTSTDSSLNYQRFEYLEWSRHEKLVGATWTVIGDERRMARMQKAASADDFEGWMYHFNSFYDGTNFKQIMGRDFYKTESGDQFCFLREQSSPVSNPTLNHILTGSDPLLTYTIAGGETPETGFTLSDTYPQTTSACAGNFSALPAATFNSDKIDGTLEFQLDEFVSNLGAKFGGSFFTSP